MEIATTEVITKITREIEMLFGVRDLIAQHELNGATLTTKLFIDDQIFEWSGDVNQNEILRAEIHRLVKRNLYKIFVERLNNRWLRSGFDRSMVERRLMEEYCVSEPKARLLLEVAQRQIPTLNSSDDRTVSIYIGIPFCVTRCLYCSFPSNVLPGEKKIAEFMTVLKRDLDAARRDVEKYNFKVQSIYIGGGTPTSLPDDRFEHVLDWAVAVEDRTDETIQRQQS